MKHSKGTEVKTLTIKAKNNQREKNQQCLLTRKFQEPKESKKKKSIPSLKFRKRPHNLRENNPKQRDNYLRSQLRLNQ